MRLIFLLYCLFSNGFFTKAFNCHLPDGCRLQSGFAHNAFEMNEIDNGLMFFIMCDINKNDMWFKFKDPPIIINRTQCKLNAYTHSQIIIRWTSSKESTILDRQFNFTNLIKYLTYFKSLTDVQLLNLKGFDLNFLEKNAFKYTSYFMYIQVANSRIDFYHDKRKINSCSDIWKLNITHMRSIFQVRLNNIIINKNTIKRNVILRNNEYKQSICPLVFFTSNIYRFVLIDLVDTFYKRSFLSFTNDTFWNLQSNINILQLHKMQNINLDLKFLHPSVFKLLVAIDIESGSLNSIDGEIFRKLENLENFHINTIIFRKINHKQGIGIMESIIYTKKMN